MTECLTIPSVHAGNTLQTGDTFTVENVYRQNPRWRWWKPWQPKLLRVLQEFRVVSETRS